MVPLVFWLEHFIYTDSPYLSIDSKYIVSPACCVLPKLPRSLACRNTLLLPLEWEKWQKEEKDERATEPPRGE